MEYIMIEKDKINGKEVYHRCSTKREENEGSRQWTYYICDNCKEHPSNSTYLGRSTQHYIINRQKENKHIFCTDKEYQEKKVKKQMNNEVTKGSNGQMNYTSGQGGGSSIDSLPLRYVGNRFYTFDDVYCLQDENNLLKTQLAELHQANVNLFNESEKLKKDVVFGVLKKPFDKDSYNLQEIKELKTQVLETNEINLKLNLENEKLKQDLELKEIINQDLVKKYKLLEEEIQAYDINMLELVESYTKLEQDYNDSTERLKIKGEVLSNLTAHTNELEDKYKELQSDYNNLSKNMIEGLKVTLQHRVKPYLGAGVVNVIIETKEDFK